MLMFPRREKLERSFCSISSVFRMRSVRGVLPNVFWIHVPENPAGGFPRRKFDMFLFLTILGPSRCCPKIHVPCGTGATEIANLAYVFLCALGAHLRFWGNAAEGRFVRKKRNR